MRLKLVTVISMVILGLSLLVRPVQAQMMGWGTMGTGTASEQEESEQTLDQVLAAILDTQGVETIQEVDCSKVNIRPAAQ